MKHFFIYILEKMLLRSCLLLIAFSALTSSRHLVGNRHRFQMNSNVKIMHSRMAPLILQEFSQLSQFENSPMRRERTKNGPSRVELRRPIYVLNSKSKQFKANAKNKRPDYTKLFWKRNPKTMEQPYKALESDNTEKEYILHIPERSRTFGQKYPETEPRQLLPIFDASEIDKMGQFVRLLKNQPTTEKSVFEFNDLVI